MGYKTSNKVADWILLSSSSYDVFVGVMIFKKESNPKMYDLVISLVHNIWNDRLFTKAAHDPITCMYHSCCTSLPTTHFNLLTYDL